MLQAFLVWQLAFSVLILGRRYTWNRLAGCFLVAAGVLLAVTRFNPSSNEPFLHKFCNSFDCLCSPLWDIRMFFALFWNPLFHCILFMIPLNCNLNFMQVLSRKESCLHIQLVKIGRIKKKNVLTFEYYYKKCQIESIDQCIFLLCYQLLGSYLVDMFVQWLEHN